jgi:hypothetical protein
MANLLLVSCQNGPQGEADVISRSAHLRSLFSQIYAARFALPVVSAGKATFWSLFSGRAKQFALLLPFQVVYLKPYIHFRSHRRYIPTCSRPPRVNVGACSPRAG